MTTIDTSTLATSTGTTSSDTNSVISSDFETFLTMLTAQMENQDPLNPVDSTDYATQLATFSSVEQQVLTNDLLSDLTGMFATSSMSELANWVGNEVRVSAAAYYGGTNSVTVAAEPDSAADSAELVVYDSTGTEVDRLSIDTNAALIEWEGMSEGSYSFAVLSYQDGVQINAETADVYVAVTEVRSADDGVALVLESGDVVAATDVTALRDPSYG
ncbi:hypothetical protein BVC71_07965 [Marivivens niveibacter]|uniref:Basal-body rod modification protein FlgD n=1 Tax=Marivivens niveibacter TaxID=1930667 RepID=A0A251X038_9RHOB|nr:flagellar hook capping FlgD N-terminal domain-containing protein [Marivivens niveibacter]OUD09755.1 hypothetical protein BVC71_07965 [Marivivens niveibacter]